MSFLHWPMCRPNDEETSLHASQSLDFLSYIPPPLSSWQQVQQASPSPNFVNHGSKDESYEQLEVRNRLKKTLYYPPKSDLSGLSKPLQDLAMNRYCHAAPRELGRLDGDLTSRVSRQQSASPCSLMIGMVFIEKMRRKNPEYLQQVSSSDLFLVSMMLASKYCHDDGTDEEAYNEDWAETGSVDTTEMNRLEMEFLRAVDWGIFVQNREFQDMMERVEMSLALTQSSRRGSATYTELALMLQNLLFMQNLTGPLGDALKLLVRLSTAYVTGSLVLLGSYLVSQVMAAYTLDLLLSSSGALCNPRLSQPPRPGLQPSADPSAPPALIGGGNNSTMAWMHNERLLSPSDPFDDSDELSPEVPDSFRRCPDHCSRLPSAHDSDHFGNPLDSSDCLRLCPDYCVDSQAGCIREEGGTWLDWGGEMLRFDAYRQNLSKDSAGDLPRVLEVLEGPGAFTMTTKGYAM